MKRRSRRLRNPQDTELNITPFMNLMVVLVPFLLLMAVFTQITVVQLALPGDKVEKQEKEPPIELEVVLRKDRVDIQDRGSDLLGQYEMLKTQDNTLKDDLKAIQQKLVDVKVKFPDVTAVSLLSEDDVDYGRIIAIMDIIRSRYVQNTDSMVEEELFPDVALGKANIPVDTNTAEAAK